MIKSLLLIIAFFNAISANESEQSPSRNIANAVSICEKAVEERCTTLYAHEFCNINKKDISCKNGVLKDSLCGNFMPKEIKVEKEAQLFACIAQVRDPEGITSGRPACDCKLKNGRTTSIPINWQNIHAPSYRDHILYPDPNKEDKKNKYLDAVSKLRFELKKEKLSDEEINRQIAINIAPPKTLGQEKEEEFCKVLCDYDSNKDD